MPHIRISGLEQEQVRTISKPVIDQLAELVGCPRDHFTIERFLTEFIFDGEVDGNAYPMIDVLWFSRSQETQDQAGKLITDAVRGVLSDKTLDICVRFSALEPTAYYENGKHF